MENRNAILAATILGSSMVFIDSTVVNVILPRLQLELHVTGVQIQWVVDAYLLLLSALILLGGALGDRFGRRVVFEVGIVVFVLASVGCGLSRTLGQLTLARSVQGIGGAFLTPGSLALIVACGFLLLGYLPGVHSRPVWNTWPLIRKSNAISSPSRVAWLRRRFLRRTRA